MKSFQHFVLLILVSCSNPNGIQVNKHAFPQGVASGDPTTNSVVIWTRVETGLQRDSVKVGWQIATDSAFTKNFRNGFEYALQSKNYCIKVIPTDLQNGTTHYYRFIYEDHSSAIGRTKTLPTDADSIKLAFVNCQKFEGGYFNGLDALTNDQFHDIDVIIHLGDYIYEGVLDTIKTPPNHGYMRAYELTGRLHKPAKEIITLPDYRDRFEQYRNDPDLQELHRLFPMINIWDDHEFANDSWSGGAKNHDSNTEGKWEDRKTNALKAYFEWIPIRGDIGSKIYRSFQFGDLINLTMLDTRICCRSKQPTTREEMDSKYEESTILGSEQFDWLRQTFDTSNSKWNVLGNQVLFNKIYKGENDQDLRKDEWGIYKREREELKSYFEENKNENFLVFSGNHHNAKYFILYEDETSFSGDTLAYEFMPGSISSGNYGEKADISQYHSFYQSRKNYNPHMPWFDLTKHGFMVANFTSTKAVIDFYTVTTIWKRDYKLKKAHSVTVYPKKTII